VCIPIWFRHYFFLEIFYRINMKNNSVNQNSFSSSTTSEDGFALISAFYFILILIAISGAYFMASKTELQSGKSSSDATTAFYAAEAGLNLRAEEIRNIFIGYNRPDGTSPEGTSPCSSGNQGSGDFVCKNYSIGNREVTTYVVEDQNNPIQTTIPPGELYQNLSAQEYRYRTQSIAKTQKEDVGAILELRFKSRLVPLFQFAVFYNKDLEILPGPTMTLSGPVHTNGNLYLNTENNNPGLTIQGQVTTAGDLYRGRKNTNGCNSNPVRIHNPITPVSLLPSCSSRTQVHPPQVESWNGMIQMGVDTLTIPEPEELDPSPDQIYWEKADLRLVLALDQNNEPITDANSTTGIYVSNISDINTAMTQTLHACTGSIGGGVIHSTNTFYNNREGKTIRMLEVDMESLLNCLYSTNWLGSGSHTLNDTSEGGLVFHFTVQGPDSALPANNYGVRIRNAASLQSNLGGAPAVIGMTVVTDQAMYTHGHYNSINKIPAAILSDSINMLSANWNLDDTASTQNINQRNASNTTINIAILSGTDSTGGIEGTGGHGGAYNGGLENYPRLHEDWTGRTLTYRGSFVSLYTPRHVSGNWIYGNPQYNAPGRNWNYDTDFNDASKLPPLSPRFVYLRQELFVREYEQIDIQ
jgi:hypothetical protein